MPSGWYKHTHHKSKMPDSSHLGKIEKSPYLCNGLTDCHKIRQGDAYWPSWPFQLLKFGNFKNLRWRRPPFWEIQKVAISHRQFERSLWNLARRRSLALLTVSPADWCRVLSDVSGWLAYYFQFNEKWIFNGAGHRLYFSAFQRLVDCSEGCICSFRQTRSGCISARSSFATAIPCGDLHQSFTNALVIFLITPSKINQFYDFSERELTFTFPICCHPSICHLSVYNARALYSAGWNFPHYFYAIWYLGHPLTSTKNFTEIVQREPLHRGV